MRRHQPKAQQGDLFGGIFEELEEKQEGTAARSNRQWNPYSSLIHKFLESQRSPVTRLSYRGALRDFFGGQPRESELQAFLSLDEAQMNERLRDYQDYLLSRRLSHSTVNHRLTTLRSLLKFAHRKGLSRTNGHKILCVLPTPTPTVVGGLDAEALRKLIAAPGITGLRGLRDTAILRILSSCALHRSQLCALDVADYRVKSQVLLVMAKAPPAKMNVRQVSELPLDPAPARALVAYLEASGHHTQSATDRPQPLFCNLDRRSQGANDRLTPDGIYYLVKHYGEKIKLPELNSRHLRHTAIASALKTEHGNIERAHERLPHINVATLQRYKSRSSR